MSFISQMTVSKVGEVAFTFPMGNITFPRCHSQSSELARFLAHHSAVLLDVTGEETANVRLTPRAEVIFFRDPKLTRR
jgi:hypothetical protein